MNQTLVQETSTLFLESYQLWRSDPYFDEETRRELQDLSEDDIFDRFYTDLDFGTAGLRGLLGAGTNRMNIYVVRKVTQALGDLIREHGDEACARGVAIAYDSRHFSDVFALETARVLAQNGIRSYLFDALRPTPELSFAVRHLHCIAGVMVTASHNPKEHNGYKVYWEDGSQIIADKADRILAHMRHRTDWRIAVPETGAWEATWLTVVGAELDACYLAEVARTLVHPALIRARGSELTIVYSPLHGAGNRSIRRALAEAGFTDLYVVPEQEAPDGNFRTVAVPNPETAGAFDLSLALAKHRKADVVLVSDPDADRLGLASPDAEGVYHRFTGNQIGILLLTYLLEQKKDALPADAVVIKTIASTDLAEAVAAEAGVELRNVHVGFKFIGEQILSMEQSGQGQFLLGFEESLGYLAGTYARDKDAVGAALLLCEAALYYKTARNQSLWEVLQGIYARHGYYEDAQMSVNLEGLTGRQTIDAIMARLRQSPPQMLAGCPVVKAEDYASCRARLSDGSTAVIDLPPADVLRFTLQGGGYVMVRPSGTEPKIKFYFSLKSSDAAAGQAFLAEVKEDFLAPLRDLLDGVS